MIDWFGHLYPYTNVHELNLDWVIATVKAGEKEIKNFVGLNTIKYADPILWDITSQYETNTVVVDGQTGNAYISVQPVPVGVALSRTEYWTAIFNYGTVVDTLMSQIASNEGLSQTATQNYNVGDLVFFNSLLYRVIAPMIAGDSFVVDSNVVKTTINDELVSMLTAITTNAGNITALSDIVGDLSDLTTTDKTSVVNAINEVNAAIAAVGGNVGDLANLNTTDKTTIVNAINEVLTTISNISGDLNDLNTTDKSNLVNAINEVLANAGIYNVSTPDSGLTSNIGLKEGVYNVTQDLTITAQLVAPKGAIINIASGVTLTINGDITAGRYQIFSGAGTVVSGSPKSHAYPEWFGAIANDPATDCSTSIQQCLNVFNLCELGIGEYYVSQSIALDSDGMCLRGVSRGGLLSDTASVIIDTRLNSDTIVCGRAGDTAIADFVNGLLIEDLCVTRIDGTISASNGIYCVHTLDSWFKSLMVKRSANCFYITQNVDIHFIECDCYQNFTNIDRYGFLVAGSVPPYIVGTNGSLYLNDCHCTGTGGSSNIAIGFGCAGAPADTFIDGFEVAGYRSGIVLFDYTDSSDSSNDIHISRAVLDGIEEAGIYFNGLSPFGSVTVENCYVAPASGNVVYSYRVESCSCPITFIGNQAVHNIAHGDSIAFNIGNSVNVNMSGNIIVACYRPYVLLNSAGVSMKDIIKMTNVSTYPMVDIGTAADCLYIAPICASGAGIYTYIYKGVSDSRTKIDLSTMPAGIWSANVAFNGTTGTDVTAGNITIV